MKDSLLIVLPYVPFPLRRGTYQRVYHLAERLGAHFAVDLFCLSHEPEDQRFRERFEAFSRRLHFSPFEHLAWPSFWKERLWKKTPTTVRHWWSESVRADLARFIEGQQYDRVLFVDLVLWPYLAACFPDHPALIVDRSRVDWLFQTEELRTLADTAWGRFMRKENLFKIARLEREVAEKLALMVVCGGDDKSFLESKLGPQDKIHVLPNGANASFFSAEDWPSQPTAHPSALFCGALDYTPNTDGLRWYFSEIHERILAEAPAYQVTLVGKNPTPEVQGWAERPSVDFQGEVPDVRPFYQQAWLQIVPLRIGGGTRLKIAEGLCLANPVVSTSLGAQGIDLVPGADLLLGDTPEEFAAACLRYLGDETLRKQHGQAGRAAILKSYTWESLGDSLAERLRALPTHAAQP
ncbi:MAG: glycosyltransferase family 4 protein [Verrucomicrobiota bacterium]